MNPTQLRLSVEVRGSEVRRTIGRILGVIRRHVGADNAIRAAAIVEELQLSGRDPERDVQAIVKFLVEERHQPIGTLPRPPYGYFILASNDERRGVRNHFVRRALSNLEHARAYDTDSIVGPLVGQIRIHFPEVE